MSSFHPLGTADDSHPLTAAPAELPFHNDDDDDAWTPPTLPGEPRILAQASARAGRTNGGGGSSVSPLDPLRSGSSSSTVAVGRGFANGDEAGAEEESYKRAVNKNSHDNGGGRNGGRNHGAAGGGQREWERGPGAGVGRVGQAVSLGGGEEAWAYLPAARGGFDYL